MILLGINCGLGNTDISELPIAAMNFKTRILDFPRPKTGIARRCVLWPETIKAIRAYLKVRPEPKRDDDKGILFITKYCQRWVRVHEPGPKAKGNSTAVLSDGVGQEYAKLMRATRTKRKGRSFYALRHTFRTIAADIGDRKAVDLCMGHENVSDVATAYVERIGDQRLTRLAHTVQVWLFRKAP